MQTLVCRMDLQTGRPPILLVPVTDFTFPVTSSVVSLFIIQLKFLKYMLDIIFEVLLEIFI
uniref:Uncharacterized protein n=1 Tax=Heterorhabditis bacteriophora TaxID=37862 RepID=A0A1I7WH37_HETBA